MPAGLTIDTHTGQITGTPTDAGVSTVTLSAAGDGGATTALLRLEIDATVPGRPGINNADTASATAGQPFSLQIDATNHPTQYFVTHPSDHGTVPPASSLPAGLNYDTHTGIVSGTPTTAGEFTLQLAAINPAGVGAKQIKLQIAAK